MKLRASAFAAAVAVLLLASVRPATALAATPDSPREREHELEQLTPAEIARRAAEVPDHAPLGLVIAPPHALSANGVTWASLGPSPIAGEYWSGNAPASGRVNSIVVHPHNPAM